MIGLADGLYADTDGVHAQYFNHYYSVESVASPNVWPIEIDTCFGVAAVTYTAWSGSEARDGMGDTTRTMLGCRCTDNAGLLGCINGRRLVKRKLERTCACGIMHMHDAYIPDVSNACIRFDLHLFLIVVFLF